MFYNYLKYLGFKSCIFITTKLLKELLLKRNDNVSRFEISYHHYNKIPLKTLAEKK